MSTGIRGWSCAAAALAACAVTAVATAVQAEGAGAGVDSRSVEDLQNLSIEELADVEVTSVSKHPEQLSEAPAAAYVITREDLRRSGVLTLPEALRLAPNLEVSRVDGPSYAISARGFNGVESSNKLLVLIDGRSVYTPLASGVFWETQNVALEDVERIEVVSGPGGTLWGANAVNGVINVISRDARDTEGGLVTAAAGSIDRRLMARWGGKLGDGGGMRVYVTGFERGSGQTLAGASAKDGWNGVQGGFRADWGDNGDHFTLQGDLYRDELGASSAFGTFGGTLKGGNLLGRWRHTLANGGFEIQAYYDRADRRSLVSDSLETFDIQAQHDFTLADRHMIVWGGGYRLTNDEFINNVNPFVVDPTSRSVSIGNLFVQDDVKLSDRVSLTLGVKVEDSTFSGIEVLPSARLAWQLTPQSLLWGSVSRAVRSPSRIERELIFPGIVVNHTFEAEHLLAWEAGYRGQYSKRATYSISAYYNQYDDLRTNEFAPGGGFPVHVDNSIEGETWGVEAWGALDVQSWWRLTGGANFIRKDFRLKPGHMDLANFLSTGNDPEHQFFLRSEMTFRDFEVDLRLRAIDELPRPKADAYVEADARIGWWVTDTVELAVVGANLLDDHHQENGDPARARLIPRSIWASLRWSF
jgi:iron complex outermembrane receptor protein